MLNWISPYRAISADQPLFALELRRVRWGGSTELLRRGTWRWLALSVMGTLIAWAALMLAFYDGSYRYFYHRTDALVILFFAALAANLIFDGMAMRASVGSISGDLDAGRWDLLRLTLLNEHTIVGAKLTIARIRSWRGWIVVFGMRIGVVLIVFIQGGIVPFFYGEPRSSLFVGIAESLMDEPLNTTLWLGALLTFTVGYLVEPFWRLRAMTALGVWLSTWTRSGAVSWLMALFAVFVVWLTQAMLGFVVIGAIVTVVNWFDYARAGYHPNWIAFIILTGVVISAAVLFGYYLLLGEWSLRRAVHRLPRVGE